MNWTISYYNERLEQDILHMPAGILARYLRYVDLMTIHGPNLGMPYSRPLGDGLLELRLKAKEGIGRVFYCTLPGQKIVMVHQFIKKSQKIPPRELRLARQRMQEVQDADTRRTQGESPA
jgi:phage-related protein